MSGGDEKTSNLPTAPPSSENSVDKSPRLRRFAAALKAASRDRVQLGALEDPQAEAAEPRPCGTGVGILHEPGERIFALAAPLMLARGWSVWPQERDGRRMPSRVGDFPVKWGDFRERLPTDAEMAAFCRDAPAANVAIALGEASGRAFAVDVDSLDPEVSARVQEIAFEVLGRTPLVRIGRAPKVALLYRYADGPPPSSSHRFDGREGCALEILGHLKPLTMWGRHHSTSQWFRWPDANPLMTGPEAAPAVDRAVVVEFLRAVEAEFPFERKAAARAATLGPGTVGRAAGDGDIVVPRREGPKLTDAREAHLRDLAWAAVRLNGRMLLAAHAAGGLDEALGRVTAAVCQQFQEDCEMSGRWADGLPAAAEARVRSAGLRLVEGGMTPAPEGGAPSVPGMPPPGERWRHRKSSRRMMREDPEPYRFVLPGFPEGAVGMLLSAGGTGKSTLALGLAASLATGRSIGGLLPADPEPSTVMYLSIEDPEQTIHHRLRAISKLPGGEGLLADELEDRLLFSVPAGTDYALGTWKSGVGFLPSRDLSTLREEVAEARPRLLIVDTLSRALSGVPENDNSAMVDFIKAMEAVVRPTGSACLVLHHVSKWAGREAADEQQAVRGASAIVDCSRWVSNLVGMTREQADRAGIPEEERSRWLRWVHTKSTNAPLMPERWLRRAAGGALSVATPPAPKDRRLERFQDRVRQRMEEADD